MTREEIARALDKLESEGHIAGWHRGGKLYRRPLADDVYALHLPGCWQIITEAGVVTFITSMEWITS